MKALYLLIGLLTFGPAAALAQVTAVKAGRLVDPEAGTTTANQVILVEGSKIAAVGANLRVPEGARVIDLSTTTVLPGLFDCHSHLGAFLIKPQRAYFTSWVHSTAYRMIRGVGFAREMLEAGFTTVRDLGEAGNHGDTDLRRAIEEGFVVQPTRLLF